MEIAIRLLEELSSCCNALLGIVFFEKHFTPFFRFGSCCPNLWWPNAIKAAFYQLCVIYDGKHTTCVLPVKKNVQIQQATNQQQTKTERL